MKDFFKTPIILVFVIWSAIGLAAVIGGLIRA